MKKLVLVSLCFFSFFGFASPKIESTQEVAVNRILIPHDVAKALKDTLLSSNGALGAQYFKYFFTPEINCGYGLELEKPGRLASGRPYKSEKLEKNYTPIKVKKDDSYYPSRFKIIDGRHRLFKAITTLEKVIKIQVVF